MADSPRKAPADYDGRFGEQFDDEIDVGGVVKVVIGTALTCAVAMALTWGMVVYWGGYAESSQPAPSPLAAANERLIPDAPLLQSHPEDELEALFEEMKHLQESYGWLDEASGRVRIPIDRAMDVLLERGVDSKTSSSDPPEVAGEAAEADAGGRG